MEAIIRENELLNINENIKFIKSKFNISNYIILELSFNEFIQFCYNNNIKMIFYNYRIYDKEKYLITEDLLKENTENKNEFQYCKNWADEYNAQFDTIDFERPYGLVLVAAFETFFISYKVEDNWLDEDIKKAIDALMEFQSSHEDELNNFYNFGDDGDTENPYEELTRLLLNDKNFRYCTNKEKRRTYLKDFLKNGSNRKYLLLARGTNGRYEKEYRLLNIFEQIYFEYKNKCYKLKLQVGEALPINE